MAKQTTSTSLILALHARYEIAWLQYQATEARKIGATNNLTVRQADAVDTTLDDHALKFRLEEAMRTTEREIDALRASILFQVPTTWQEALILAAHVHNTYDLKDDPTDTEKEALQTGLDTLLDFLFGKVVHDELDCAGGQLLDLANIVYERRRIRRGEAL